MPWEFRLHGHSKYSVHKANKQAGQEHIEEHQVSFADAFTCPWTVMVVFDDADFAFFTMLGFGFHVHVTNTAIA